MNNIFSADIAWSWLVIRSSGIVAWALLSAVVFWGLFLRTRILGTKSTPVALLNMHRWLGALALGALTVHLVALLIDPVVHFTLAQILIPGMAPWEPIPVALGTLALWFMLPVSAIGRLRTKLGKKGNVLFKRSHLIAYFAWPLATAHYLLAGTDALAAWSIALVLTVSIVLIFLLLARGYISPAARKANRPQPNKASVPSESASSASASSASLPSELSAAAEKISVG